MVEYGGPKISGNIKVRPYLDKNFDNMGLQNYGMTMFEGVFHEEQLACIEGNGGMKRYVTGLNEYAPEIKKITDPEVRAARILEIRKVVSELEKELATNIVDPEDPEFWNKVKLLRPDNYEFWDKISIRCGNDPLFLKPDTDPYDRIKLYAIEAGGFSIVARSYDDARTRATPPKFFLDKYVQTVTTQVESKKVKNKALTELQKLFDKNTTKLLYVAKVVDINSISYKKSTPNDVVYSNMDTYINGEGSESNGVRAAETFLKTAELDMDTLKLRALVKDATYYKFIIPKSDGFIYYVNRKGEDTMLGRNPSDVVEFMKNPLNDQVLGDLSKKVEQYWNS